MNYKKYFVPASAILTLCLAGCGDKNSAQDRYSDTAQPMGYYSNEDHQKSGGNARMLDDNDGAITEMLDHSAGDESNNVRNRELKAMQNRDENGNPINPTKPYAKRDRNFFAHDNRYQDSDLNYHGHLNTAGHAPETNQYNADLSERIERSVDRVENVEDVRAVVYGDDVLVAAKLMNNNNEKETIRAIKKETSALVSGRNIKVATDEKTYIRIATMDKDLKVKNIKTTTNDRLRRLFQEPGDNWTD
ncbi:MULTISPECIES: YhcN/YlaJ family sporulation lipoprotein [unclassified Bacillus (in: firmicutes)]|uniref:YhcN/YlaJ family sporulation lipoprotein n=1 Tax=unclassified Bacillus (in: firmicutes) TaxID=185979 RepID=UPI0008E633B9|nr:MULTISPECIES: YhcN/YlaJ family sporulation lipoprotein [unclassified Bacillus (in: firmicutes)]SFA94484.1 spore cortex protein [Bacillus sp. UNCCL13]SFQ78438.1 spore cortex protein [Bacillus sp. cl95]